MIIYIATNRINNKSYIGKTIYDLQIRKNQHINDAKNNTDTTIYFHRALNKYGDSEFYWNVLWKGKCNNNWLNNLEKYYIYYYDTFNNGYNMTEGGDGGALWTKERIGKEQRIELGHRIAKLRDDTYLKGKNHWLNKVSEDERNRHIRKMLNSRDTEYLKGDSNPFCQLSSEKRMETILKGNAKRKLYKASDETKKKMSETRKNMYKGRNNPLSKVYKLISPNNKIFIVKDGLLNFCNDMNLSFGMIRRGLKENSVIQLTSRSRITQKVENTIGWRIIECQLE